jgi:hypothetical protein
MRKDLREKFLAEVQAKRELEARASEPQENTNSQPQASEASVQTVFTQLALGLYKKNDQWYVAEIKYNEDGETSDVVDYGPYEDKGMAIENFKIKAANENLV